MFDKLNRTIRQLKNEKPIVLNITNYVTMDFVANGLLSLGASPIMSKAKQEIAELLQLCHSVVINIGTLNEEFVDLSNHTCQLANQLNKPIILDPVGAGASRYRTETCLALIHDFDIAIIRGNASEIMALSDTIHQTKGVDSAHESNLAIEYGRQLSRQHNATIVISGKTDIIIDNEQITQFERGSPLMPSITGTGCLLSAVVAAFHSIEKNRFDAAQMATLFYSACGEIAENQATSPGSFKTHFLDALHSLPEKIHYEN